MKRGDVARQFHVTGFRPPSSGLVLPGNRASAQVAFEASMVDFFVSAADLLGFLPAYSPDLNPIEMMWSKVKSCTHADLLLAIANALRAVTAQDALGWFVASWLSLNGSI